MSRSIKKGPYVDQKLLKKLGRVKPDGKTVINTYSRDSQISPEMIGYIIGVHNGRHFIAVNIAEDMVGHRLGEFSLTRKFVRHGGKMQREIEQKAQEATKETAGTEVKK